MHRKYKICISYVKKALVRTILVDPLASLDIFGQQLVCT